MVPISIIVLSSFKGDFGDSDETPFLYTNFPYLFNNNLSILGK